MMEPELAGESPVSPPTEPQKKHSLEYLGRICGTKGTGDWVLLVIITKSALITHARDVINLKAGLLLRGNEGEALGSQVQPREVSVLLENLQMASGK